MINYPLPKEIWKHYKGGTYEIISLCSHTETKEVLVIYRSLSFGSVHARPLSVWNETINENTQRFIKL
jgi:hypothetical protein